MEKTGKLSQQNCTWAKFFCLSQMRTSLRQRTDWGCKRVLNYLMSEVETTTANSHDGRLGGELSLSQSLLNHYQRRCQQAHSGGPYTIKSRRQPQLVQNVYKSLYRCGKDQGMLSGWNCPTSESENIPSPIPNKQH